MKTLDKWAQRAYLELLCAENHPEQVPEYVYARWYDLLWFLIPICGIIGFFLAVRERYEKNNKSL